MQPLQYNSRPSAAKGNGIPQTAAAARNIDGATTVRPAETESQSSKELCTMAPEIAGPNCPNPNLGATAPPQKIETLCKRNFKTKITSAKIEKSYSQITIATLMQPLQYDSRPPAAKDNEWYYTNSRGSEKP